MSPLKPNITLTDDTAFSQKALNILRSNYNKNKSSNTFFVNWTQTLFEVFNQTLPSHPHYPKKKSSTKYSYTAVSHENSMIWK